MSLTQKEKVQLRRQSKRKVMPTGLYLYHPASDRWIPAQADEEGRLVIDPSDLDTRYLKLDGSNKAKLIDIDYGSGFQDFIYTTAGVIWVDRTGASFYFMNRAQSAYGNLFLGSLFMNTFRPLGTLGTFLTGATDKSIVFMGYSDGNIECARLKNDAFSISRAGDITVMSGKRLSCLYAKVRMPMNRPASPVSNEIRYDAASDTLEIYDGAAWKAH